MRPCSQNQNKHCKKVTHPNDNHSQGPGRLVPSSDQRCELGNTITWPLQHRKQESLEVIPISNNTGKEATLVNISISNGILNCKRTMISAAPDKGESHLLVYWLYPSDLCPPCLEGFIF